MRDGNQVTFEFNVDPNVDLSGLRVNLHLSGYSTGIYEYSKTITVIDGGKVLIHRFKENYEPSYTIEALDTKRNQRYFFENSINDGVRTDYTESYMFSDKIIVGTATYMKNRYDEGGIYRAEYSYTPLVITEDIKPLNFYNPKNSEYQMSELSNVYIEEIMTKSSFEDLKTDPKIKEKDILRLPHLTEEQKQELIKIHSKLEFDRP